MFVFFPNKPGRYTYAREVLSKGARNVMAAIDLLLVNSDTSTISEKHKLFDAFVKPVLLYGYCRNLGP